MTYKTRFGLGFTFSLLSMAFFVAAAIPSNTKKVHLLKPLIDVGHVDQGKIVSAEFFVHNDTVQPIIIEAVPTSCGCTIAKKIVGTIVEPGNSARMEVDWETRTQRGVSTTSRMVLYQYSSSNGQREGGKLSFSIRGIVDPDYDVSVDAVSIDLANMRWIKLRPRSRDPLGDARWRWLLANRPISRW